MSRLDAAADKACFPLLDRGALAEAGDDERH
jgi:hypothetical protein